MTYKKNWDIIYISGLAIASGWNRWKIIFRPGQRAISQRLNVVAQRKPVLSTAKIRCSKPANMWKDLAFGKDLNRRWTWNSLMLVTVWSKAEKVSRAIFLPCTIKRLLASPFQNISKFAGLRLIIERDNVSKLAITKHEKVNLVSVFIWNWLGYWNLLILRLTVVILRRVFNCIAVFCIAYYVARGYFRRDETNTATMRVHSSWRKDAKIYSFISKISALSYPWSVTWKLYNWKEIWAESPALKEVILCCANLFHVQLVHFRNNRRRHVVNIVCIWNGFGS